MLGDLSIAHLSLASPTFSRLSSARAESIRYLTIPAGKLRPGAPRPNAICGTRGEELVDDGQEGVELRLRAWCRAAIAGRLGVVEDLRERVPVDVVLAAGGALAQAVDEDAAADLGPGLHVGVHP